MDPEELEAIRKYLAELRQATQHHGQEAFQRNDADEAQRHVDRLRELNHADAARVELVEAIGKLYEALAAFPPLPAEQTPTLPRVLQQQKPFAILNRPAPVGTTLAPDLDGETLTLSDGPRTARARMSGQAMIVLAGSQAREFEYPSIKPNARQMRQQLLDDGGLVKQSTDILLFTRDVRFTSVSAAADTILARSANGRTAWRRPDGRTLHNGAGR